MKTFYKPKIMISACLEHRPCRYDGTMISSHFVKRIKDHVEMLPICPEVEIGLSVPREALRIVFNEKGKQLLNSFSGQDHTNDMTEYTQGFLSSGKMGSYHGGILKSRSPSCGVKAVKMYKSTGKIPCLEEKSAGFFGGSLLEFDPFFPLEDEGRLLNYEIRDHFLTRIFTLSAFDQVKQANNIHALIRFHSDNKYLLMASHQSLQKTMGKLVANHEKNDIRDIIVSYEALLKRALNRPMEHGKKTNMILHIFGYFSKELSSEEKAFFLDQLSQYNANKIPFSALMTLIYAWVIRFDNLYLKGQTIFEPYPRDILDVMDSGKGVE